MRLKLHVGPNKTGSTYVQKLLRANTGYLADRGILFPSEPETRSSNNARSLALAYRAEDWGKASRHVEAFAAAAREANADTLLLSSEYFFRPLSQSSDAASRFLSDCKRAGLNRLELLCFVREPVSWALSQYSQRIGRNDLGAFVSWFRGAEDQRHTGRPSCQLFRYLEGFIDFARSHEDVDVHFARYSLGLDAGLLAFLGLDELPEKPSEARPNASQTVTEAHLTSLLFEAGPRFAEVYYVASRKMSRQNKASDGYIRRSFLTAAHEALATMPEAEIFRSHDALAKEAATFDAGSDETPLLDQDGAPMLVLSRAQIETLVSAVIEAERTRRRPKQVVRKWRNTLRARLTAVRGT